MVSVQLYIAQSAHLMRRHQPLLIIVLPIAVLPVRMIRQAGHINKNHAWGTEITSDCRTHNEVIWFAVRDSDGIIATFAVSTMKAVVLDDVAFESLQVRFEPRHVARSGYRRWVADVCARGTLLAMLRYKLAAATSMPIPN